MATTDPAEKPVEALYPRLTGGPSRLLPEDVARHQRERLESAMVEVVARHGFAGTTMRELVTLAGVSKSTFYEHFANKEECFLATYDSLTAGMAARIRDAHDPAGGVEAAAASALAELMDIVLSEPRVASFVTVDALTLGGAGVAHRERAWSAFERMAWRSFGIAAAPSEAAGTAARAVIAGLGGVVYRHLRSDRAEELPGAVDALVEWALSYRAPDGEPVRRAIGVASMPNPVPPASAEDEKPGWEEPPDSVLSRAQLGQRERIVRAAGRVAVERGYSALSIPAISAAAGTSNQTFYEHFASKRDAFLAAYESTAGDALEVGFAAFRATDGGPEAIGAGMRALTEHIASHPIFARLAFFELAAAGPAALDRADATLDALIAFLEPGERAPSGLGGSAPRVVLEAAAAGIWSVIQCEVVHERAAALPAKAPELTRLALAPLSAF
jgi:AcrR family transcriptional regulator